MGLIVSSLVFRYKLRIYMMRAQIKLKLHSASFTIDVYTWEYLAVSHIFLIFYFHFETNKQKIMKDLLRKQLLVFVNTVKLHF